MIKKCKRCKNDFNANPIIQGDDVCLTCSRMNDITFWYPRLFHLGFPMPKTIIIHTNVDMERFSCGEEPEGFNGFLEEIKIAIKKIGLPVFLKTGYTSNKHDWKKSCLVSDIKDLKNHVFNLAEFSAIATIDRFMPCDFWAVREIIKTEPYFAYFSGKMPITKEVRAFVNNGKVVCKHPYWPEEVFEGIDKKLIQEVRQLSEKDDKITDGMASYVARLFSGYWSVDLLKAKNGEWYLTDMAIGESSWHDKDCKK